ncbi:hypothetical protein JW848_02920 [Candidatus Bipolaricaulota bacterium]|nr:hypothetical protein [Candidatus Bipolaricaulota bacterium]
MTRWIGAVFGVVVAGFVFAGIIWLLWWLFVVAAIVAVAAIVWRAVTQR